jgi:hypothetical protein
MSHPKNNLLTKYTCACCETYMGKCLHCLNTEKNTSNPPTWKLASDETSKGYFCDECKQKFFLLCEPHKPRFETFEQPHTTPIRLHKSRRQTHVLCGDCFQGYYSDKLSKLYNLCRTNKHGCELAYIKCTGHVHQNAKNICSKKVLVNPALYNQVNTVLPKLGELISKIIYYNASSYHFLCLNDKCQSKIGCVPIPSHVYSQILCDDCDQDQCVKCLVTPFHTGKSCLEYQATSLNCEVSKVLYKEIQDGTAKECPGCKAHTTRNGGCNKIVCVTCSSKWCWICQAVGIDYSHYNSLGVGGCSGKLWLGTGEGNEEEEDRHHGEYVFG